MWSSCRSCSTSSRVDLREDGLVPYIKTSQSITHVVMIWDPDQQHVSEEVDRSQPHTTLVTTRAALGTAFITV